VTAETTPAAGPLFARFADDAEVGLRLLCFPYAGGGAQMFRSWQPRLAPGVGVTGIRLPGREQRFREPAFGTWPAALAALTEAVGAEAERGPYAFFGHSLGARLCYELAHRLAALGVPGPRFVVLSACRAPGVPARRPAMHLMDRPTLRERLRVMRGVPEEVLASDRMMDLMEPVLRADLRLAETWEPSAGRIAAPILALCGDHDDIDPYADMADWRHHTTGGFTMQSFPAGHFFLHDREESVVAAIAAFAAERTEGRAR
jgi:medium-chain acyl-[acyl-carrier-protein] hydrolase